MAGQAGNGISQPGSGETVAGIVELRGTAVHPEFLRYELAFSLAGNLNDGWIVFAEGDQPVADDLLAVWNTTVGRENGTPVFPDGVYQLRLRVVKTDYNYDEFFVTNLIVSNETETPTPTPDETAVAATETAVFAVTPFSGAATSSFVELTTVPSLTPFPTPTPPATPPAPAFVPNQADENTGGVVGQLRNINLSRFRDAFWLGVRGTGWVFATMALYLLFRAVGRRLWRFIRMRGKSKK